MRIETGAHFSATALGDVSVSKTPPGHRIIVGLADP